MSSKAKPGAIKAYQQAQAEMNVAFQVMRLEAQREIYYHHLVETLTYLQRVLKEKTGRKKLDGWIVCGSGLASLPMARGVKILHRLPTSNIPHWFTPQAPGHGKEVIFADVQGQLVGIATGRAHLYDTDSSPSQLKMITAPLIVAKGMGIDWLVTTNAAGANSKGKKVRVGDMAVDIDYVNQHAVNPLFGPNDDRLGQRFPSKAQTADPQLFARLAKILPDNRLHLGIYTLESNAPLYEGLGDLARGSYAQLLAQNPDLVELHGMSFALEAMVMQHFNAAPKDTFGLDRPVHWIGLTAVTNVVPSIRVPHKADLLAYKVQNANPTSETEVLEGASIAEKMFIPAIVKMAKSISEKPLGR